MTESKLHVCSKLVYCSTWKRFQNRCEWSACFHGAFSLWYRPRVSKLWPVSQIRPAKPLHPARQDILSKMKNIIRNICWF